MHSENTWIQIVDTPIDLESLRDKVDHLDAGAHGWFVGVTRRTTAARVTDTLSYEAHRPMATRELEKLADAAVRKFSLHRLVIVHRLGEVPIGQASVVVGCSSSHRPQTFGALSWIMDTLKREVPIWKREIYSDGTTEWVHPITDDVAGEMDA
jgi:molybdopterin synthase catalytic subunit